MGDNRQEITNQELLRYMQEGFSSIKKDFATKQDLEAFATKKDLESFATKKDLERFATKEDVTQIYAYGQKFMPMKQDLEKFPTRDDLAAVENRLLTHIDGLAKRHETFDQELVAMQAKYERLDGRLEVVEKKVGV